MLEVEGLVKSIPKRGSVVRTYSQAEIEAMYDLRALLEGHAARKAALAISSRDIDRLEDVWRDMQDCIVGERYSSADQAKRVRYLVERNNDFHKIIINASQNPLIETTIRGVVELPLVFKAFFWYSQQQLERSNQHHKELMATMRARNPNEAERVMVEHINGAREVLLNKIRVDQVNGRRPEDETAFLTSVGR